MTTYFHSHEFCCSPKKSGSAKGRSSRSKSKSKSHHLKTQTNFLTPNHQLTPVHSPKKHSPKHRCHSPKSLLPSPSPSYYHIPASSYQLGPPSPSHLLHSPSHNQLHLSPSQHQIHLSPSQHQIHLSPSQHQLHLSPSQHQIHLSPSQHQLHPQCSPSPGPMVQSGLFQHHYHHHHCHGLPPPLPHASQSLSIHPFHSPQLPLCAALAGYGYSTLPTHLAHFERCKSPSTKDGRKSPSKSKGKGKGGNKQWPKDTYIWTPRCDAPYGPVMHHLMPIHTQVQVGM